MLTRSLSVQLSLYLLSVGQRGLMMARGLVANGAKTYIGSRRKTVVEKAAETHGHDSSGSLIP